MYIILCLPITGEFVWGSNVLGSAAAGGARAGRAERQVRASYKPSDVRLLVNRISFLVFQLGFQPSDVRLDQRYSISPGSARFEDFEEVFVAEDHGEVSDMSRGEWCHSLAIPCGDGRNEVEAVLVDTH